MSLQALLELAEHMAHSYVTMTKLGVPDQIAKEMSISAVQTHYAMQMQKDLTDKMADAIMQQEKKPWE